MTQSRLLMSWVVLQRSRGDEESVPRRLLPLRRPCSRTARWVRLHPRPEQGHHHLWWRGNAFYAIPRPCFPDNSTAQNASSLAIEQELSAHPDVLEASVVARPHPKWGERPMAFVILKTDAATKWAGRHDDFGVELKRHARSRLPGFACPEWVKVVNELPVRYYLELAVKGGFDRK
jgi:hypothetical protein